MFARTMIDKWIDLMRATDLRQRLVVASEPGERHRVPVIRVRVIGFELEGAQQFAHAVVAPPLVGEQDLAEGRVRRRQRVIERQRFFRRGARPRHGLARPQALRHRRAQAELDPAIAEAGVGQRITRIDGDRAFETLHRLQQALARAFAPQIAAAQVMVVGSRVVGVAARRGRRLAARERQRQRVGNALRQRILELERIARIGIELLGPQHDIVAAATSCTVTRTLSPARRMLPAMTASTPSLPARVGGRHAASPANP